MSEILTPVGLVFAVGLIASIILAYASQVFYIQEDETYLKLRAELPGANCGGCGYAGCDDYAHALTDDPDGTPADATPDSGKPLPKGCKSSSYGLLLLLAAVTLILIIALAVLFKKPSK